MPTNINGNTGIDKVQDGTVVSADIATLDASKLTGSIAAARIASNTIDSAHIASGAVDDAHLATGITASKLTGTIADARFPSTLPAASAANLTAIPAANITGALPAISGAALTNLPSSNTGKILQTVYVENDTDIAFPQNTSYTTTVVQASITPASTSSTILCWYSWHGELNGGNYPSLQFAVLRDSTEIQFLNHVGYMGPNNFHRIFPETGFVKDSPNTTSSVTYYLNGGNNSGSGFSGTYGGHANGNGNKSSILLIEVGA